MGGRFMNPVVKRLAAHPYPYAKSDVFACFIERGYTLAKDVGHISMVTMESWLFLSSFEKMRKRFLEMRYCFGEQELDKRAGALHELF